VSFEVSGGKSENRGLGCGGNSVRWGVVWKLVLLGSLLPTVAAVLLRQWQYERVLRSCEGGETPRTGRELVEWLLGRAGVRKAVEITEHRRAGVKADPPRLALSPRLAEATDAVSLGEAAQLGGLAILAARNPDLLNWRQWVVRFGAAAPVFTLVVAIFAVVVAKLTATWAIAAVLAALGLASVFSLLTVLIESEAAKLAASMVEESRFFHRLSESEAVARCCRAFAFRESVPGAIEWLFRK